MKVFKCNNQKRLLIDYEDFTFYYKLINHDEKEYLRLLQNVTGNFLF